METHDHGLVLCPLRAALTGNLYLSGRNSTLSHLSALLLRVAQIGECLGVEPL